MFSTSSGWATVPRPWPGRAASGCSADHAVPRKWESARRRARHPEVRRLNSHPGWYRSGMAAGVVVPTVVDMLSVYADNAIDLGVDLLAIFLLAFVLYFRRHRRADLLLAYVALNIGIFVAMSLLGRVRVDIALGFGLFAILSIIRLRSSAVTQQEVAYYFVALVLGLVNGLDIPDRRFVVLINVLLLATMLVVDCRPLRDRARRLDVTLDAVHDDDAALVADLERRLGGRVLHHVVNEV